jgi:membrane-associated protease RseP (regulator of RpoE activity)
MRPAAVTKVDVPLRLSERRKVTPPATVSSEVYEVKDGKPVVLKSIGGRPCATAVDAYAELLKAKAGEPIELGWASGTERVVPKAVPLPDAVVQAKRRLGLGIQALSPMLAEKYGLAIEDGLLVTDVIRGSVAGKAGIEPGDILVQLGRYRVRSLDDLAGLMEHLPATGRVRVGVIRGEQMASGFLEF